MQISDEMVKVALAAWQNDWLNGPPEQNDKSAMRAALSAALALSGWRTIDSAPKDGTWILIADDHCWPPDLVRWQNERPERVVNGNLHMAVPRGWFGSPGGRSRFDVPDGHLMKATRWKPLDAPPATAGKEG